MSATERPYSELEYTSGYYHELGPAHLAFCALVAGIDRPAPARPIYLELGMGQGVSLAAHAAASDGEFWGVDLNPAHVANARALAEAVSTPLTLVEGAFADFAARDDLPLFDVITLHGVWSWVSDASRRSIVEILRDRLAPGGVVYLSYNCQPGWASRGPIRHLMKLGHGASAPGDPEVRVQSALAFAEEVAAADGRFFAENRPAASHLASLRKTTPQYLGHEYLNADWHIPWFSDVAEAMAEADLTFAVSARLLDRVNVLQLPPAGVALMDREKDPVLRESIRDFLVNQQFRPDVFARPAPRLSDAERTARFEAQAFVLVCGLDEIDFQLTGAQGEMVLPEATYRPIALALAADGFVAKTGAAVMAAPGVSPLRRTDVIAALINLVGMGVVRPAQAVPPGARARCEAYNRLVLDRALTGPHLMHLASPVTGGGVLTPRSAQLFLRAWIDGDRATEAIARSVWAVFRTTGERAVRKGETLMSEDDNLAALGDMARRFLDQTVPLFRALAIV
ncbi:class I SAM-dependent methyltransferase [Brevundimonas subvibrioides]|uniref:Methyltransferase regulatory domain, predicted n=1 Tax=Brevundimonas subvibrioides (strain ATCC 15264 / DSM 4735 / LMG 14903 / NBRC 16000 / CB 81) TaxID=633149 RepID=D9QFJ6_BRESC|nr:class I SAM-dependent methyltransferase [Brevundimonas subvibrioides]ADL02511.1 Methyltransferase regulatory domain, predicted [Brevundimonas subvibrioides ATCC 15264]